MTTDSPIEPLPRLSFFEIAAETPVVILDGLVYYLLDRLDAEKGHFVFEGDRYGLVRTQSLASIERQYLSLFAEVLERYKANYLRQVVDKRIQIAQEMRRQLAESNVLAFLITQLIPRFMELDLGKELFDERRKARKDQALNLSQVAKARPRPMADTPLQQAVGANTMILDDWIYPLVRVDDLNEGADLIVRANGVAWGLSPKCQPLGEAEAAYMTEQLPEFLKNQARDEVPERMRLLNEIVIQEHNLAGYLDGIAGTSPIAGDYCLYHDKEWGILKRSGVFYVYIEVPEYVVEDAHGSLYRFDATQVGVAVPSCNPGQVYALGSAVVLTPYQHMFVAAATAGSAICMPRGEAYFAALRRTPLDEALCTYLKDAKETLRAGYHAGNPYRPFHPISSFSSRRITRREAEEKRLPVYPFYRDGRASSFTHYNNPADGGSR
jgi:hypothetical protein